MAELMREVFRIGDSQYAVVLSVRGGGFRLHLGDETFRVARCNGRVSVEGETYEIAVASSGDRLFIHFEGRVHEIDHLPAIARLADREANSNSDHLVAPMPGAVISCEVQVGDTVAAGDLLMVIESMKLETSLRAWRAGRVAHVHVGRGQNFERDMVLLSMEAA
jgi:acetyl/propionyl-CoA carboxylase alpha subunit